MPNTTDIEQVISDHDEAEVAYRTAVRDHAAGRLAGAAPDFEAEGLPSLNRLSRHLYRAARLSRDASAVLSGHPRRVIRRVKNHAVGRALARVRFWRRLWR